MGRPKKNKKAEIKARRKTRKINERVADLKRREKRARAYLKMISENAETLQKLAEAEAQESTEPTTEPITDLEDSSSSSFQDDQSSQSTSE